MIGDKVLLIGRCEGADAGVIERELDRRGLDVAVICLTDDTSNATAAELHRRARRLRDNVTQAELMLPVKSFDARAAELQAEMADVVESLERSARKAESAASLRRSRRRQGRGWSEPAPWDRDQRGKRGRPPRDLR